MVNKSKSAKQAIIRAGRELLSINSLSNLSVRHLMERASVNHGLFHYYFKTKERFYEAVIQDLFNDFGKTTSQSPVEYKNPVEKLRALLIGAAFFVLHNWALLWPIVKDPEVNKIVRKRFHEKVKLEVDLLRDTLRDCRRKGYLVPGSDDQFMVELLNVVVAPIIFHLLISEASPDLIKEGYIPGEKNNIDTHEIYKRVNMALARILKPNKARKART